MNKEYRGMHNGKIQSASLRKSRSERISHQQRKSRRVAESKKK